MGKSAVRNTLLLLALAIGAVSAATNQRQVGGFVAQLPPQTAAPTLPPQAQTGHRHITERTGVAITSRLEPEDRVVEVIRRSRPFYDLPSDPETEIRFFTAMPAVAVIRVEKRESAFSGTAVPTSDFYSPEDWIKTTLTAEVQSVVKDTTGQLVGGGLIEITESGGEVVLGDGRRIIARDTLFRPTKVGGTYLAVLDFNNGKFFLNGLSTVEFDNGEVKRLRRDAPDSELEKRTPEWVTQRARAHVERGGQR